MTPTDDEPPVQEPALDPGIDMLRQMLASPRAIVDAAAGPLVFALVNAKWGLAPGALVAGGVAGALTLYRLARKQKSRQALIGFIGTLVALAIALLTRSASAYFVPGVVIGSISGVVTLLTALFGYPLTAMVAQAIQHRPAEWYRQKDVRASHIVLTVLWGLILLARAGYRAYLIRDDRTVALGFASVLLGYPVTAAFVLGSIWFLRLRGHGGRLSPEIVTGATAQPGADDDGAQASER